MNGSDAIARYILYHSHRSATKDPRSTRRKLCTHKNARCKLVLEFPYSEQFVLEQYYLDLGNVTSLHP